MAYVKRIPRPAHFQPVLAFAFVLFLFLFLLSKCSNINLSSSSDSDSKSKSCCSLTVILSTLWKNEDMAIMSWVLAVFNMRYCVFGLCVGYAWAGFNFRRALITLLQYIVVCNIGFSKSASTISMKIID